MVVYRILFIFIGCFVSSCMLFKSLDKSLEDTAIRLENRYDINLDSIAKGLGKNLVRGATAEFSSDTSKRNLNEALGNILLQFSDSLALIIEETKGSLLNEDTDRLVNARIENLGRTLKIEVEKLLGGKPEEQINALIDGIIDRITSEETMGNLRKLRNELLGDELKALTDSLVRSAVRNAVDELARGYDEKLKGKLDNKLDDVEKIKEDAVKDIRKILYLAGGIGVLLISLAAYFYFRARRNRDTLKVLTNEIDRIDERAMYDKLVGRIHKAMSERGLEKHLAETLKEQNLYQQPQWLDKNKQILDLIIRSVEEAPDEQTKKELLEGMLKQAEKSGIRDELNQVFVKENNGKGR